MSPRPVIVLGAGQRIRNDVLPAFFSLPADYDVRAVFGRSERDENVGGAAVRVRPLSSLSPDELSADTLIYSCVSKGAVPRVLAEVLSRGAERCELLIDTPVLLFKQLGNLKLLRRFAKVSVAEDCSTLPWIPLVHRALDAGLIGTPGELQLDRSAWRYHGLAMARTLWRAPRVRRARRIGAVESGRVVLDFGAGRRAVIQEPRDYASGRLLWSGSAGAIASGADLPSGAQALVFERVDGRARAFRLGELREELALEESALLGAVSASDTPVARTHDLKRVGLRRLLQRLPESGYPLERGLEDSAADFLLEKFRRWRPTPLTSPAGRLGGALLGLALRPIARR
ncbi:MAG: hypothetical protein DHS20C15_26240 [Planctomycetota bacterium]|nr:MAG: hypothetical protein DHS20C15_26240 [Planctomycetota bacterium]